MKHRLLLSTAFAVFLLTATFLVMQARLLEYTLTTADGLSLALDRNGRITALSIGGRHLPVTPGPALQLRDLSDAGSVITPNLVVNPGFETGLSPWSQTLNQGLDVSVVVSPTHGGGHALAFTDPRTRTGQAGYASNFISVTPGRRYRLSGWFLSSTGYVTKPTGTPPLTQMAIWRGFQPNNGLYVVWLDEHGTSLGPPELVAPLHAEASRWRLIRGEVTAPAGARQARAIVGVRISDQTVWVDDVAFVPSPEPYISLGGTVTPCPGRENCLRQTTTFTGGLVITITYTAHSDHISVHGDIADTTGRDRALDVNWGIPLTAAGGTWWDDAHTSRTIAAGEFYANEISAIYDGWQPMSLYPYAGVQIGDVGLALGLPLDRPQLALLAMNEATGRYGTLYHLGISPQAVKVGPHATFDLMLYRFDPAWGFRDVIARHQRMQASFYTTPRARKLYEYQGRSQGQYYTPWGVRVVQHEDGTNTYSAQYVSSDLALKVAASNRPRPTMDYLLHVVTLTLNSPYTETAAMGQAIVRSAAVDPNGEWSLKQVGIFPWDTMHWEAAWAGNVDPDIDGGLAPFLMQYRISRAFSATARAGAHLDGVQIDNFMTNPTYDLRPEALAATDWPLGFTPHTYQPAVHTGFAQEEFLDHLRRYLDENWGDDRGITINFWALGHGNYLARYIDGFGSEGGLHLDGEGDNFDPPILDYRRAIAAKRPYLFTVQASGVTASQAYTACQLALLYGVYPGHGPNGHGWDPAADQIISGTASLVGQYWAAGWGPLTYARATDDHIWIERFGSRDDPAGLFFAVHNTQTFTQTASITIETRPLGLTDPTSVVLTDIAITQTLPFQMTNGDIRFGLTLGPEQTRVIRVSVAGPQPTPTAPAAFLYMPLLLKTRRASTRPPDVKGKP